MKYQYNLTSIEPHKDGGFREIHICNTESLEAVCHEILRYKKGKKPQNFKGWRKFVNDLIKEQS
jgi:hypothetical protein